MALTRRETRTWDQARRPPSGGGGKGMDAWEVMRVAAGRWSGVDSFGFSVPPILFSSSPNDVVDIVAGVGCFWDVVWVILNDVSLQ